MGTADRDYFRDEEARYTAGERPPLPPVTKILLIANLAIFFVDMLFFHNRIANWGRFSVLSSLMEGRIWELVTFQFLHGGAGHVIFNSLGIYFFGPWIERWWGSLRFTFFYLLCGAAGALFYTLLTVIGILPERGLPGVEVPLVGASAGIYGMLVGVAIISPGVMVSLLFPPVTMTIRQLAMWVIGIAIFMIVGDNVLGGAFFRNSGGEAGHLGGAILGFFLVRYPFLLGKGGSPSKIIRPKEFRRKNPPKLRPRSEIDVATASEVDRILDKIAKDGLKSLTNRERDILQEAAKSQEDR